MGKKKKPELWVEVQGSNVSTDGNWVQVELEDGQRIRIVQPSSKKQKTKKPQKGQVNRPRNKHEGPVILNEFEYADETPSTVKEFSKDGVTWTAYPSSSAKDVRFTRIKEAGQVICYGFPTPPEGEYVYQATGAAQNLTQAYGPPST